jgi:hypothetical protein
MQRGFKELEKFDHAEDDRDDDVRMSQLSRVEGTGDCEAYEEMSNILVSSRPRRRLGRDEKAEDDDRNSEKPEVGLHTSPSRCLVGFEPTPGDSQSPNADRYTTNTEARVGLEPTRIILFYRILFYLLSYLAKTTQSPMKDLHSQPELYKSSALH